EGGDQDGIFRMLAKRRTDRVLPDAWGGYMDAGDWDRNAQHPAAMWLLLAASAMLGCLLALALRPWFTRGLNKN
ncbi:MAG TPA: hypothetical protein P5055_23175, partial [Candidatus Paceibacterota bacterium]|nr:hypothetical protein [Candidatus Paceibacterota bacterium]